MGLLWKTEGTRRIVATLNLAFEAGTGQGLDYIRNNAAPKILNKIAKGNWQPGHLARMLQLYPYDQPVSGTPGQINPKDRKRWHYFLKAVIGKQDGTSTSPYETVFKPLRAALSDAITRKDSSTGKYLIDHVSFDHVEVASIAAPTLVIFDLPGTGGTTVRHITLLTVAVDPGLPGEDPDPPDGDEQDFPGLGIGRPPWKTS